MINWRPKKIIQVAESSWKLNLIITAMNNAGYCSRVGQTEVVTK
jgi:hypothetical protein